MGLNRRAFLAAAAAFPGAAWAGQDPKGRPATTGAGPPPPLVLERATVINVTGKGPTSLSHRTVVIAGGRIKEIGEPGRVPLPEGAVKITATNLFICPGFWDAHAHCAYEQALPLFLSQGVTGIVVMAANPAMLSINLRGMIRGPFNVVDHVELRSQIEDALRKGPRLVHGGKIVDGPKPVLGGDVRAKLPLRELLSSLPTIPRGLLGWEAKRLGIGLDDDVAVTLRPQVHSAASPKVVANNALWVNEVKKSQFVKAYSALDAPTFRAILSEAKKLGKPRVAAHVPFPVGAWQALDFWRMEHGLGLKLACSSQRDRLLAERAAALALALNTEGGKPVQTMQEVLIRQRGTIADTYDAGLANQLLTQIAEHQKKGECWLCPTLAVRRALAKRHNADFKLDPRRKYVPPLVTALWDSPDSEEEMALFMLMYQDGAGTDGGDESLILPMYKQGIKFLAGSDEGAPNVFPGFSLHDELEQLVAHGLPPLAALQAATINVAESLGLDRTLGSVEVGKEADLVLLEANPLECIGNTRKIRAVIRQGELLTKQDIKKLLDDAAAQRANAAPAG